MEPFDRVSNSIKWWPFRALEWLNCIASIADRQPVQANADFPWVATVEGATDQILAELRNIQATLQIPNLQDIAADQAILTDDDRWKAFYLYGYGYRDEVNCRRCPSTDRALQSIPGLQTAMFSILEPGKQIPTHRGPINGLLRYHLGLVIPDKGTSSGIRIGDKDFHWQVGKSLIFDDTVEHTAWNRSDQQRVIVFVDFERPLRFPVNLLNKLVLYAIRRSPPVGRAVAKLRDYQKSENAVHPGT